MSFQHNYSNERCKMMYHLPSFIVIFRSNSFLKRTVCTPEMALTTVDFPCATWPIVPMLMVAWREITSGDSGVKLLISYKYKTQIKCIFVITINYSTFTTRPKPPYKHTYTYTQVYTQIYTFAFMWHECAYKKPYILRLESTVYCIRYCSNS